MTKAFLEEKSQEIEIRQPSGLSITAKITYEKGRVIKAVIKGAVQSDGEIYEIDIS